MNYTTFDEDHEFLVEVVARAPVFEALADGAIDRRELEERLDVSRATCHRIVRSFEDRELVTRTDDGYELTSLGSAIGAEVRRFTENVTTATRVEPLLEGLEHADVEFDLDMLHDPTVTRPHPQNPYGPIDRFMTLLRDSTTLRSLDRTSIAPLYVGEIVRLVVEEGLTIEAIYGHGVVKQLLSTYAAELRPGFETGRVRFRIHEDLSFGLSIFDERVGIRAYDPDSGAYTVFVDTGSAAAYAWAEEVFESYWSEATRLSDAGEFPDWAES